MSLTVGPLPVADCEQHIRKAAEELTYSTANRFSFDPKAEWFIDLEESLVEVMSKAAERLTVQPPVRYNVKRRAA